MGIAEKIRHNKIAEMLKSTSSVEVGQATQEMYSYINMVHGNSDSGFISIFHKESKSRWGVASDNWLELTKLVNKKDIYASVNSFYSPVGCISSKTKKLNAIFIDLDYYNIEQLKGLNAEEVIQVLRKEVDYPEPSIYIDSGNGLYLMWLLNNTYATTSSRAYWKKIEETLIKLFKPYGADTKVKDHARVLRIPGTINSKTGRMARVILPGIFDDDIISYSESPPRFELEKYQEKADLIITHGGVGSIVSSIKLGKKVIAIPRLHQYQEHVNDHQKQIVESFSKKGYIIGINDVEELEEAIYKAHEFIPNKYETREGENRIIKIIEQFIENI